LAGFACLPFSLGGFLGRLYLPFDFAIFFLAGFSLPFFLYGFLSWQALPAF
jgi:hypothetical protein